MTRFEPAGIGSDRNVNCATTTAQHSTYSFCYFSSNYVQQNRNCRLSSAGFELGSSVFALTTRPYHHALPNQLIFLSKCEPAKISFIASFRPIRDSNPRPVRPTKQSTGNFFFKKKANPGPFFCFFSSFQHVTI